ncbi:hypothetical protein RvY_11685 [Ramazzottius varieornatus]|uniref:Uncharacterized protein n=1 Tax=Ramazzottius varieornatus TaxID=947166 RepID=A0A1D1VH04_RAMVA|nr:hypothetical protein RvY_11685 [Ramazzottius varieornatus]
MNPSLTHLQSFEPWNSTFMYGQPGNNQSNSLMSAQDTISCGGPQALSSLNPVQIQNTLNDVDNPLDFNYTELRSATHPSSSQLYSR